MLVINALSAADHVLIPVQADYLAAEDMTELVGTVHSIRQQINPKLKIGGVFLTMANDTNFRKDIVAGVKKTSASTCPYWMPSFPLRCGWRRSARQTRVSSGMNRADGLPQPTVRW